MGVVCLVAGFSGVFYTIDTIKSAGCGGDFRGPPAAYNTPRPAEPADHSTLACCAGVPLAILGLCLIPTAFKPPQIPAPWSRLPANRLLPRMALWRHQIAHGRANVPRSNLKPLKMLRVLFDGQCIGVITATSRLADRFFGYFVPGTDFDRHRLAFDEAWQWSRQFEDTLSVESIDDAAWEGYIAAIRKITDRITLPEFPMAIEVFGIDHYLAIEVKLAVRDV